VERSRSALGFSSQFVGKLFSATWEIFSIFFSFLRNEKPFLKAEESFRFSEKPSDFLETFWFSEKPSETEDSFLIWGRTEQFSRQEEDSWDSSIVGRFLDSLLFCFVLAMMSLSSRLRVCLKWDNSACSRRMASIFGIGIERVHRARWCAINW